MFPRLIIAVPASALLVWLSYWSITAHSPQPADPIQRGLDEERAGDLAAAERSLLAAAQMDRLYEPRWTLAGFYFRHDRTDDFWVWARRSLEVGTHDFGALFDLCWRTSSDEPTIWRRAIPERREIWNEYLAYLLDTQRWEAATKTAVRLAAKAIQDDVHMLLGFCDLAIGRGDNSVAAPIWNSLCERGLVDSTPIGGSRFLVNGDLLRKPQARGFDWRLLPGPGARVEWLKGELHITLSGSQAANLALIDQPLALTAGAEYRLTYRYRTRSLGSGSGAHWEVTNAGKPLGVSVSIISESEGQGQLEFPASAANLTLRCDATPGAGTLVLRDMNISRE